MNARVILVGFVLSLSSSLACDDEEHCDVNLDEGDYDEKICDAVGLIVECVDGRAPDGVEGMTDEHLRVLVDGCDEEFTWCSIDAAARFSPRAHAFDELRGTSNDCVG